MHTQAFNMHYAHIAISISSSLIKCPVLILVKVLKDPSNSSIHHRIRVLILTKWRTRTRPRAEDEFNIKAVDEKETRRGRNFSHAWFISASVIEPSLAFTAAYSVISPGEEGCSVWHSLMRKTQSASTVNSSKRRTQSFQ
eukprot:Gb_40892 [translate_table: standard]